MNLSVIIPVYNAVEYLPKCIHSILAADVAGMEILLVDDGSTDGSQRLCKEYQEKYKCIKCFFQENSGPSKARNTGLEIASGEYIAFIDSDDYVEPQVFAQQVEHLLKSGVDVWVSDFYRVADNGCVLDEVFQIQDTALPITKTKYLSEFLSAKDCVWNVWRYFFRRAFLMENDLFFAEGYNCAEDLEFVVRAITKGDSFGFFHCPYYKYRVNYGQSLTRIYTSERVNHLMEMLLQAAAQLDSSNEEHRLIGVKLAREYILNLSLLYEVPKGQRVQALKTIKKARILLELAGAGVYRAASVFISFAGIRGSALLLYVLKGIKRAYRGLRMKLFSVV